MTILHVSPDFMERLRERLKARADAQASCEHKWKILSRSLRNGWQARELRHCQKCDLLESRPTLSPDSFYDTFN